MFQFLAHLLQYIHLRRVKPKLLPEVGTLCNQTMTRQFVVTKEQFLFDRIYKCPLLASATPSKLKLSVVS